MFSITSKSNIVFFILLSTFCGLSLGAQNQDLKSQYVKYKILRSLPSIVSIGGMLSFSILDCRSNKIDRGPLGVMINGISLASLVACGYKILKDIWYNSAEENLTLEIYHMDKEIRDLEPRVNEQGIDHQIRCKQYETWGKIKELKKITEFENSPIKKALRGLLFATGLSFTIIASYLNAHNTNSKFKSGLYGFFAGSNLVVLGKELYNIWASSPQKVFEGLSEQQIKDMDTRYELWQTLQKISFPTISQIKKAWKQAKKE